MRRLKTLISLIFLLQLILPAPTLAQSSLESVNVILPGCRDFLKLAQGNPIPDEAMLKAGICIGKISTLNSLRVVVEPRFRFCPPQGATLNQTLEVALKGLEMVPENWHQPFDAMALAALIKLWPCQN